MTFVHLLHITINTIIIIIIIIITIIINYKVVWL